MIEATGRLDRVEEALLYGLCRVRLRLGDIAAVVVLHCALCLRGDAPDLGSWLCLSVVFDVRGIARPELTASLVALVLGLPNAGLRLQVLQPLAQLHGGGQLCGFRPRESAHLLNRLLPAGIFLRVLTGRNIKAVRDGRQHLETPRLDLGPLSSLPRLRVLRGRDGLCIDRLDVSVVMRLGRGTLLDDRGAGCLLLRLVAGAVGVGRCEKLHLLAQQQQVGGLLARRILMPRAFV